MTDRVDSQEAALCSQSPTGKHHWMIPSIGAHPVGICKWCNEERRFNNSAGDGHWDPKKYQARKSGSMDEYTYWTPHTW